jgi:hypothetical protein
MQQLDQQVETMEIVYWITLEKRAVTALRPVD